MDTRNDNTMLELINNMAAMPEKFEHIKIFLGRNINDIDYTNLQFLMVTPTFFGKVRLDDLECENDQVILHITDLQTNNSGNVRVDMNIETQTTLFIYWKDLQKMVWDEMLNDCTMTLLEFQ